MDNSALLNSVLTQGLSTGVVLVGLAVLWRTNREDARALRAEYETRLAKKEADCAEERKQAAQKHEELQREMLAREIQVRDRERSDTLKVVGDNTAIVAGHTRAIVDMTAASGRISAALEALATRKSQQSIQAVK